MKQSSHVLPAGYALQWYQIERVLGQGGFGITYLARDSNLDIAVAIKEYLPAEFAVREADSTVHARSDDYQESYAWGRTRFVEEARLLATFDHPAIVRVHTFMEANNTAYMVMRYEEGTSLKTWFKKREFSENELLGILHAVLNGLEVIHARNIIHRDIKPDNIYIRTDGQPVLLDFGSARHALGEATRSITAMVSSGFSALEQYSTDAAAQGPWTDIYGLAATLYYGISGRAPLDAMDRSQRILTRSQDDFVPAHELAGDRYSKQFCTAIDRGLAFRREQRPQSVAAWRAQFPAYAGSDGAWSRDIDNEAPTVISEIPTQPRTAKPAEAPTPSTNPTVPTRSVTVNVTGKNVLFASLVAILGIVATLWGALFLRDQWSAKDPESSVSALSSFQDTLPVGSHAPAMQVLPPGAFLMGAGALEPDAESDERPQHEQVIASAFAIAAHEVTVADFARFVEAAEYETDAERSGGCFHRGDEWQQQAELNWRNPGFEQSADHPVVCVSRQDANAYVQWLSAQTGRTYRLPTESEWEYAARAGAVSARYWGDQSKTACDYANTSDQALSGSIEGVEALDCRDGFPYTAPVGTFRANAFGLKDVLGNVWEWTSDCWLPSYLADSEQECGGPVLRGGSWSSKPRYLRSANRYEDKRGNRSDMGFRVASDLQVEKSHDE